MSTTSCSGCGRAWIPGANFCTVCGARAATSTPDFMEVWAVLFSQLDTARNKWFELTKEIISDEIGPRGGLIVNAVLDESRSVDMGEDETPASYPFNTVDGATVEGFIIGWQIQVTLSYCTGELAVLGKRVNYVNSNQTEKLFEALVKSIEDKPRWVVAMTTQISGTPVVEEDVTTVVAHYLLGDPADSPMVQVAREAMSPNPMGFLKALCCMGTAAAFGDAATVYAIQAALKSHE
jgi:hypothetical protein